MPARSKIALGTDGAQAHRRLAPRRPPGKPDLVVAKLRIRAPSWLEQIMTPSTPGLNPLLELVPGPIAEWEVGRPKPSTHRGLRDKSAQRR